MPRHLLHDERGSVVILTAVIMAVVLGIAALAIDLSHGHVVEGRLQSAADAGALAAVIELQASNDPEKTKRAALDLAQRNTESDDGTIATTGTIFVGHYDSKSKRFTPDAKPYNAVRVVASRRASQGNGVRTFFATLLGRDSIDVSKEAIAVMQIAGSPCILALDPSGSKALSLNSNASIDAPKCEVHSSSKADDSLSTDSNAVVVSQRSCVKGKYSILSNSSITPIPEISCDTADDPFLFVPPPQYGGCDFNALKLDDKIAALQPGVYCGGLSITGNSRITFDPGTYIITGGKFFVDSNSVARGTEVGFFLTSSKTTLEFNSNTQVSFTAPKSGPLSGFIFYQDRRFGGLHRVGSNTIASMDGAVYLPKGELEINSNAIWGGMDSPCLLIVVDRLMLDSNTILQMPGDYAKCPAMQGNVYRKRSALAS